MMMALDSLDKMDDKIQNWDNVKRVDQFEGQRLLNEFKENNQKN